MDESQFPAIFDGHNDVLLRIHMSKDDDALEKFINGGRGGHLDIPRMQKGGFGGGFFAIYVPSPADSALRYEEMNNPSYDLTMPPEIPIEEALPHFFSMAAILSRIERLSDGAAKICRTAKDIRDCIKSGTIAMVMHIEGAEAIDENFNSLEVLYNAGLRSIGPVWSRTTRFGFGVPFRYPGSPDTGPGLTDSGRELIRQCNFYKMVVDLSHLNEVGFWDVASISDAPLIATHSNVHAICPHTRNLTNKQLAAIRESGGMVGVNFATAFIRPDGQMRSDTTIDEMLRHMDYLIEHVGIDGVGFGSDFDGAMIPEEINDVVGLTSLRDAMRKRGYDKATMTKLCHGNWIRVIEKTFGE